MSTTTTRVQRGRFSPSFNSGIFLQFVRDITRDFTLQPAMAPAGSPLYNYLEGDGQLRYYTTRCENVERIVGVKRALQSAASFADRVRAIAATTTDGLTRQSLEQLANGLGLCAKQLAAIAEASDVNDERETLHNIAEQIGEANG